MKSTDVLACSFPSWYPDFSKVSIKSVVLPLPEDVLRYLRSEDSVVLPLECDSEWTKAQDTRDKDEDDTSSDGFEEDEDEETSAIRPTFPEFSASVKEAVDRLGGDVFCKLNWSAPRDATWVGFANSLRCTNLSEIYLLLRSSDFIRHDLTLPFKYCDDDLASPDSDIKYHLVLRKWTEINPGHEFRCFVRRGALVGITQRDGTNFYRYIGTEKESILRDVTTFFKEHVVDQFPLENYVFDLVRRAKDSARLIDFNPFGRTTDSILFDWEEELLTLDSSNEADEEDPQFRYVETDSGIQPNELRQYSLPIDVVDLASGTDANKLVDFLKLQQKGF